MLLPVLLMSSGAAFAAPSHAPSSSAESLAADGRSSWAATSLAPRGFCASCDAPAVGVLREEPQCKENAPWVKSPFPEPTASPPPGAVPAAELDLAEDLDSVRTAAPLRLGQEDWLLGFASDAGFRKYYLAFTRAGETRLVPLSNPKDLLGEGLSVPVAERESYRVRLRLDLTAPVRDSRLEIWPELGASRMTVKTGDALDHLEAAATRVAVPGRRLFVAYLTDLDAATGEAAETRSFFFFEEHRFFPKAWRVPGSSIPQGQPLEVLLGRTRLVLVRSADEKLSIFHPNPKGPSGTGR